MHATKAKSVTFLHHGDFSGDVRIVDNQSGSKLAEIPFEDLKALMAEYVREKRISALDSMSADELLLGHGHQQNS